MPYSRVSSMAVWLTVAMLMSLAFSLPLLYHPLCGKNWLLFTCVYHVYFYVRGRRAKGGKVHTTAQARGGGGVNVRTTTAASL